MALAIDFGPLVRLQRRLSQGALGSAAAIYVEGLVAVVLLGEGMLAPVALVPMTLVMAAQARLVFRPARLLLDDRVRKRMNRLARACHAHLVLAAVFVGVVWAGATGPEARGPGVLLATIAALATGWPVLRMAREAQRVAPQLERVSDCRVLVDCLSLDVRGAVARKLESAGGSRLRASAPLIAALATGAIAALALAAAVRELGFQNGPVGVAAALTAAAVYYLALRSTKPRATELRAADARPPVLFLRQFVDDAIGSARVARGTRPTFEHVIAAALARIGPTIAIGKPGERLQPLGAAREYLPHSDWQGAVDALIRQAVLVVFVLGDSENLLWEFRTTLEAGGANRTLVLIPPLGDGTALRRRWERFAAQTTGIVGTVPAGLPARRVLAIAFAGTEPVLFVSDERPGRQAMVFRTEPDYRLVVRLFAHLLGDPMTSSTALTNWVAAHVPMVDIRVITGASHWEAQH